MHGVSMAYQILNNGIFINQSNVPEQFLYRKIELTYLKNNLMKLFSFVIFFYQIFLKGVDYFQNDVSFITTDLILVNPSLREQVEEKWIKEIPCNL